MLGDKHDEFVKLVELGVPKTKIAQILGKHRNTITKIVKRWEREKQDDKTS